MDAKKTITILQLKEGKLKNTTDDVIVEYPLQLSVNEQNLVKLMCTPLSIEALAIGFLFSESIINGMDDIKSLTFDEAHQKMDVTLTSKDTYKLLDDRILGQRTITTGCGKNHTVTYPLVTNKIKRTASLSFNKETALELMREFNKMSTLFQDTGGVHSCALSNGKSILIMEDDIGRHNALDKIIGKALRESIDLTNKLLFTSGRLSSEIVHKLIRAGIPAVLSRSAPTTQAIELAKDHDIILIGFARGNRMNLYS